MPGTLGEELDTNPFLRPHSPAIRAALRCAEGASDEEVFAAVRAAKDKF